LTVAAVAAPVLPAAAFVVQAAHAVAAAPAMTVATTTGASRWVAAGRERPRS
jgi:hypothetical protein